MNLNYAAYLMNEDVQLLCEDADSEGKKKAKKWIIDNWELCYGKNYNFGTDDENRIKEIKEEKSEELFQTVDGLYNHPMDHTHGYPDQGTAVLRGIVDGRPDWEVPPRYDSRGSKVFTPAIVRLLITELGFNSRRVDKTRIRTLHKIILVAYMQWRADNSKWNRDLNGKSYKQLFNELSPYFDEAREWFKNLADTWQRNNADHPERVRMIINRARGINEPDPDNNAVSDTSHDIDDGLPQPDLSHAFRIGSYNAVYIPNHQAATYWNKYTNHTSDYAGCNWCITMRSPSNWNSYDCGNTRTVYFLFKDNFKTLNITDFNNDMSSQPDNEYGRSLLCVMVERFAGEWTFTQMTSRYNHCDGRGNAHSGGRWGDDFVERYKAVAAARVIGCTVEEMIEKLPWRMPGSASENVTAAFDRRILNNMPRPFMSVSIDNKKIDLYKIDNNGNLYKIAFDGVDILHKWFKYCRILLDSKYAYVSEDNAKYPTNLVTFDGEYLLPHDVKRIVRIIGMNEGYLICSKESGSSTQYNIFNAITHQYLFKKDKTLNFKLYEGDLLYPTAVYIDGKFSLTDNYSNKHIITKQGEEITPELNEGDAFDEFTAGTFIYNRNDKQLFTLDHKLICTFPSDKHISDIALNGSNVTTNIIGIECIDDDNSARYYMVYNLKKNKLASPTLYRSLFFVNKRRIILLCKFDHKYDIMFEDGTMIDSNVENWYGNPEIHSGLIIRKDGKFKYVNLNTGKIFKETTTGFSAASESIINSSFADDAVIISKDNRILLRSLDNKFSDILLREVTNPDTMRVDQSFTINSRTGKYYCINLVKCNNTAISKAFIIKDNGEIDMDLVNVTKVDDDIVLARKEDNDSDTAYAYILIDFYTSNVSPLIRKFVSWFDDHGIAEVELVARDNISYFINLDFDIATSIDELDESVEITKKPNTLLETASYLLV